MYVHVNEPSPCHLIRNTSGMTLSEYLESDWLKAIKTDYIEGRIPEVCMPCKAREDMNLKSTRLSVLKYVPKDRIESLTEAYKDKPTDILRLELRASNLCNFKCRMCNENSSSEIAKEKQQHHIPLKYSIKVDETKSIHDSENTLDELKKMPLHNVRTVCFTGGEPMLIKQYYDFMDHLIDNGLNEQITLEFFTNCSVYNPNFIDRMLKFKKVDFVMSIDGVGKTAEYQRHGTKWDVVENNILTFNKLDVNVYYNTCISPYVLLDASSLAKFLMRLYEDNKNIKTKCYTTIHPPALHILNMNEDLRRIAIYQIDQANKILNVNNFEILAREFNNIKKQLENSDVKDYESFAKYTKDLDILRNESFEEVFGYHLY